MMKNVCVFCGSSKGNSPKYVAMAKDLGEKLHDNGYGLVYGGASIGVMGAIADSVLERKGQVIGVMPASLVDREVEHKNLTKFERVGTMHERKERMYDYSDAFLAIPGGMGTLDELCEIVTWAQLQYHKKPIYLMNYDGFFNGLIEHFKNTVKEGFLSQEHFELVRVVDDVDDFFERLVI
jgi:uncharacterized protein (TIGR00730 family)